MTTPVKTENLLEDLAAGKNSAFQELYRENFNMVRYLIEQNSGDEGNAADIFQEVMIILFEKCRDGKLKLTSSVKTYIYSIARNLWLKRLREKRKNVRFYDFEDYVEMDEDSGDEKKTIPDVKVLIGNIGEACRQLLILFYYRKKSMQEICDRLGYSNADTAKTQKYKCLQKLRKQMVG